MQWLWAIILIYIIVFGAMTSLRHYNFETQAWDLGIYSQTFWNSVHGRVMQNSIEEIPHHFGVHFNPFLFLLLPGYAIFQSPYYLLWIQTIALALGAWPLYLLAKKRLTDIFTFSQSLLPATIVLAYLLYPPLHWVNWYDFHPIAFLVPLFLVAFYFAEIKNWKWFSIFSFLAASVQEDAILVVAFLGIYLMIKNLEIDWKLEIRNWKFAKPEIKIGLLIFSASILYFLFATKIIMPYFGGGLLRLDRYDPNIFWQPELLLKTVFGAEKILYVLNLLWPVAFLPLFAPKTWILLVPGLAQNLLTEYSPQFTGTYQYDSVLIGGIFIATALGVERLTNLFTFLARPSGLAQGDAAKLSRPDFQSGLEPARFAHQTRKKISQALLITSAIVFLWRSPIGIFNFPTEFFKKDQRGEAMREMVLLAKDKIGSVAANTNLVPHLAEREKIYMLGAEPEIADIVLIDGADYFGFKTPEDFQKYAEVYASSPNYNVQILQDRYYILIKKK